MTFSAFWHILTTSRYTRRLEEENADLRKSLDVMTTAYERLALAKRTVIATGTVEGADIGRGSNSPAMIPQRGRPGRFKSFGAAKRELESQEPPQRSVNV